jgi:formamidopyrimidine-DNA glycosylase
MPELPEVEIAMRGIAPFLEGQSITECILNAPALRYPFGTTFRHLIENSTVLALQRRGKYILFHLDNSFVLVWHLGMSGRIYTFKNASDYIPGKHDHVIFRTAQNQLVVYNDSRRFGFMRILPEAALQNEAPFMNMGPEPLGNTFSGPVLFNALKNKLTPIKTALLDQHIVAGIGNIYASEALFKSFINPTVQAGKLQEKDTERLATAIKSVLNRAIEAGGSSLRDYQHTDGSLGYFQHMFQVYNRAGQPCQKCSIEIIKIIQNGRSTFYCPHCQK